MIYKRLLLLMLVASVGACSNMPSFMGGADNSAGNTAPQNNAMQDDAPTNDNQSEAETAPKSEPVSQSTLLAQSLMSQSDLFQSSRRMLSPSTKTRVVNALSQFNKGEYAQSEKAIKRILATELNLSSGVYVLAGDIALANNKAIETHEYYKQALKLNDYNAKAANRLGLNMREQGKFREAEKLYTQAINAQPSLPNSYRNRAVLYDLYLNEKAKALEDYTAYSALINYQLSLQDTNVLANTSSPAEAFSAAPLSEQEIKALKKEIKIVSRWLVDVGRQVDALNRAQNINTAGE